VVNALEYDGTAHCCCGDHDAGEPCGCPDCPGHGEIRWRTRPNAEKSETPILHSCHGRGVARTVASVPPALAPVATEPVAVTGCRVEFPEGEWKLEDRLIASVRPPP
jgi:hypothetical protein